MATIVDRDTSRRTWLRAACIGVAALGVAAVSVSRAFAAGDYPDHPVRIILPFGTGGASDITARLLSEHLEKEFGQRFLVENRPGANSAVAARATLAAGNDGYALFNMGNSATIRATLMPNLPSDFDRFDPISPIAKFGLVWVTRPNSELKAIQDVVDYAKANPGRLNIGTVARGSTQNLSAELFKTVADIDAAIIPFRNSPEVMGAVARQEVDIALEIIPAAKSAIDAGQVVPIATTLGERSKVFPDVPTVEESGVQPFNASSWNCYVAPKGVPKDVVTKLNTAMQRILKMPEVQEKMLSFGIEPFYGGPETVSQAFEDYTRQWREVIIKAGLPIKK